MVKLKYRFLVTTFFAVIGFVPVSQVVFELTQGDRPVVAELVLNLPTEQHLREVESEIEETSWFIRNSRSLVQRIWFRLSGQPGENILVGLDGWLFYLPTVRFLVEPFPPGKDRQSDFHDPLAAITDFHRQLAGRGIQLLVVPVPGKASIYPERVSSRADPEKIADSSHTLEFISQLNNAGIPTIDLFEIFHQERRRDRSTNVEHFYLSQDTHWTPEGAGLAAQAVAQGVLREGWVTAGSKEYAQKPFTVARRSDILRMARSPSIERLFPPQEVTCQRVFESDTGNLYQDDLDSPVLVLGDSFLRIYQTDNPKAAGFLAHLAKNLRRPLASIVNDGGASTLVRQQLSRNPDLLEGKKLVVWEFVERDLRFGMEGWQKIPIPSTSSRR